MDFQWLGNLSIKSKFLLVILPPFILATMFGILDINSNVTHAMSTKRVIALSNLVKVNSNLVHELQKERGMSAGFIGSKGSSFADALPTQRNQTDVQAANFAEYLQSNTFIPQIQSRIIEIKSELQKLGSIRQQVSALQISVPEEVAYYSKLNQLLLSVIDLVAKTGEDKDIAVESAAFSVYLQMKERAGIERAVLSSTFGQNGFKPNMFTRFVTLVSEQNSFQSRFIALGAEASVSQYQQLLLDPKFEDVEAFRKIALAQNAEQIAAQSAEKWFAASTARIELLRKFEVELQQKLTGHSESVYNQLITKAWTQGCAIVGSLLLIVFVSYLIISNLLSRLKILYVGIIHTKTNFDMTTRLALKGTDELGQISVAIDSMLADFDNVIAAVRTNSDTLNRAVGQMNNYSTQLSRNVEIGHGEAEQVASAMTEMSSTVQEIATSAVKVTDASKVASQEAKAGNLEVGRTADAIGELAQEIEFASNSIQQLDTDIHGIVGLLAEINGIAEQTNLLALNAAIEAARAGEMGRGFAVVADEVRNLAQRSQSSTEHIRKMTDRLKLGAQNAVSAIAKGQQRAEASVVEANRAGEELYKIVAHVESIESMNEQIAAATHQQSVVSDEVNRNALKISDTYSSTKQVAEEFMELNKQLLKDAEHLRQQVAKFKTSIN
ncbi:methyl-accepting chemotaxis protein [Shewanella avicenniae]|uniref:Methyl-accepting chemotaxis protein n=1 Tax=Shewanella avicenniae TaxID=2814294 RepID=A0ABX7QM82_9GAMM|nr:methyl-accepting chemotaxis protein [Shewanella avicenniae]QSX31995.1 methyl-accepting chemotaxis protein [Shewanella avicenniae]